MKQPLDYQTLQGAALPAPKPGRAGSAKTIFLAVLAVAVIVCAAYWLTRTPAEKTALREMAAYKIDVMLANTPLASLAKIVTPPPPPLPPEVTNPQTDSGTLAGRQVTGTIAAPMDFGEGYAAGRLIQPRAQTPEGNSAEPAALAPLFGSANERQQPVFNQEPVSPVTEDSRIRSDYVAKLAQWLVNRYKPGPQGGTIAANVQSLNQEAGGRLASGAQGGRAGLLKYAFHPAMISGLYNLYIGRFMEDLDTAARNKGLSAAEIRQFHRAMAGRAALLASSLAGIQRVPDLAVKLAKIDKLAQRVVDENADLATAVFELDEQRNAKAGSAAIATAQMRVDGANARYRRATDEHLQAQAALAAEIRRYSGQNTDEDTLLFMAAWVARRYAQGGQARGAIESCIAALRDLSSRFARYNEGT